MVDAEFIHPNPATFNSNSVQRQYFSLPFGIISYINENPNSANGLQKLQKTCKYFFKQNKIIIIPIEVVYYQDLFVSGFYYEKKLKFYFNNFKYWLTDALQAEHYQLENLLYIYRCNLFALHLFHQNLTLNEMDFLVNGGKINTLWLVYVNIRNDDGDFVSCDCILEKVPNILCLHFDPESEIFTSKTFKKMNSLKFNSKFERFCFNIGNFAADLDLSLLCIFIKNNSDKRTYFGFGLFMNNAESYKQNLLSTIDEMFQDWDEEEKPEIEIY